MKKIRALAAILTLLTACGRDMTQRSVDLLKEGGDVTATEAALRDLSQAHPKEPAPHLARFVLCRHEGSVGEPVKQQEWEVLAIQEYDWLAKHFGFTPDYGDMEGSLKKNPGTAAMMDAVRAPLYGR